MQSQFQDLEINMLSFKQGMKILEEIKDPEIRLKVMEQLNTQLDITSESSENPKDHKKINSSERPYLMNEVYKRIRQKQQ